MISNDDRARGDRARWDAVAPSYAALVGGLGDSFFRRLAPFLDEELGDPTGQQVWDLGCGHGWLSGILAARGAKVSAVDGSVELIQAARRDHPGIDFEVRDLAIDIPVDAEVFDAVVCHMVLMDLPVLDPVFEAVRRALRPNGRFIFTILHPAFFQQSPSDPSSPPPWSRAVTGYREPEEWWIESFGGHRHYHRPLEQYFEALSRHGLLVRRLVEPPTLPAHDRPEAEWNAYEKWFATIPTMLAVSAVRAAP
jgi:SAM-dependent methyltransferase